MDYISYIFLPIIIVYSITIHEFAHAWTATQLGDPTPKMQGRLSINPLVHIDPWGLLCLFLTNFGRGRPVIFNPSYLKNPLWGEFTIAMAGPLSNIIIALVSLIIATIASEYLMINQIGPNMLIQFWTLSAMLNISMAVFNLIPLPPLDGFRIIKVIFGSQAMIIERYSPYIIMIIFLSAFIPQFNFLSSFLGPIVVKIYDVLLSSITFFI